jgi:hypothetical protein
VLAFIIMTMAPASGKEEHLGAAHVMPAPLCRVARQSTAMSGMARR